MRIDVSEIKTYKTCKRQWLLTSRNRFHLAPIVKPAAFAMGTMFHEALHSLYLGVPVERVLEGVRRDMTEQDVALLAMVKGYAENVLEDDLNRFQVLDIEKRFSFHPCTPDGVILDPDIEICGSIDMICLDPIENKIYGFEHKTAKNFRDTSFLWMDEQPRVYTIALQGIVNEYNQKCLEEWEEECRRLPSDVPTPVQPAPASVGGIYINEVKKLLRDFKYQRTLCTYPADDMENFMELFFGTCTACKMDVDNNSKALPTPSYWNCQMCSFRGICETYMYSTLNKDEVIKEFQDEFVVRTEDHLDEKTERRFV